VIKFETLGLGFCRVRVSDSAGWRLGFFRACEARKRARSPLDLARKARFSAWGGGFAWTGFDILEAVGSY